MLVRQQAESQKEDVTDPVEGEVDYLFVITDNERVHSAFKEIVDDWRSHTRDFSREEGCVFLFFFKS